MKNFIIFLPLILGTATSLILFLIVIPIVVPIIFKQQQQQEILTLNLHPAPPVNTNDTIVKTPIINECTHDTNIDGGIICLPNDTKLMQQYHNAPKI